MCANHRKHCEDLYSLLGIQNVAEMFMADCCIMYGI